MPLDLYARTYQGIGLGADEYLISSAKKTSIDFTSLGQVEDRLTAFEQRYNATARPFR